MRQRAVSAPAPWRDAPHFHPSEHLRALTVEIEAQGQAEVLVEVQRSCCRPATRRGAFALTQRGRAALDA
jgi:hypothetical protein